MSITSACDYDLYIDNKPHVLLTIEFPSHERYILYVVHNYVSLRISSPTQRTTSRSVRCNVIDNFWSRPVLFVTFCRTSVMRPQSQNVAEELSSTKIRTFWVRSAFGGYRYPCMIYDTFMNPRPAPSAPSYQLFSNFSRPTPCIHSYNCNSLYMYSPDMFHTSLCLLRYNTNVDCVSNFAP